jgi:hypothetical protein
MPSRTPEGGTLIIAALLVLALGFAGYWIILYAQTGAPPSGLVPWFEWGAVAIVVVGLAVLLLRGRAKRP